MGRMHRNILLISLLGLLLTPGSLSGQDHPSHKEYTFLSRGVSLDFALQKLVKKTGIDLIYEPRLMRDQVVFVAVEKESPKTILKLMLKDSGLDFIQLSSGTYVLVKAPRKTQSHGHLAGKVVDKTTGQPLVGANVMLADASTGTSTNRSGYFNIPKLETGRHEVTVTYVGYQAVKDTVWVPKQNLLRHDFTLETKPIWVEPIIISDIQRKLPASEAFTATIKDPAQQALGTVDAVKSLNTVMGINFNLALADYNIQGGNTGENQLRLDGVPVYNPVSMGRLIGAFSPFAVGNINIYKAGFGTPVGSQLSGIINLKHELPNKKIQSVLLQVDPLSLNARLDRQFDIENGPRIRFMLAARANIWRWYEKPSLSDTFSKWDQIDPLLTNNLLDISESEMSYHQKNHHSDIHYSDIHLATVIEHNDFQTTRFSAYRGKNYLETTLFSENVILGSEAPHYMSTIDRYEWTNTMGRIEHEWLISSRLDASLSGYLTRHTLQHQYAMGNDLNTSVNFAGDESVSNQLLEGAIQQMDTGDNNGITESAFKADFNYRISKNYRIKTGLKTTHLSYRFRLSDLYLNTARSQSTSLLVSNYIQNNFQLSHKTSISAGSRFTFIPSRDLLFGEPRFAIQHDEPDTFVGYLSTKLSGGIYRQFINQFDISNIGPSSLVPSIRFWVPVDYSTNVPKAYHLAANVLWEPGSHWTIKSESYYKWMPQTLALGYKQLVDYTAVASQNLSQQVQFISNSKQFTYGTGLSIEKVLPSVKLHMKAGYQYGRAQRRIRGRFNGEYEEAPWNQPHRLGVSAEWQAFSHFMIMLQWQSIWGRSWGFRKAYYDYLNLTNSRNLGKYSFDHPSGDRLSPLHQLDAGISYHLQLHKTELRFRLHVFNLLDHPNVINWWLAPSKNKNGNTSYTLNKRTLPGFSPSFSFAISF